MFTALTSPRAIDTYRLMTLRSGLKLEIIGMTRTGKTAYSTLKAMGYKGSKQVVLDQVIDEINSRLPHDWSL